MVPEGWTRQTVGNLFEVQLGKMLNKAAKEKSPQVPYLTNFNVRWGAFDVSELNSMFFSDRDREKFVLKAGDLLVCEGGEVGRCAIWKEEITPCYYQKALHRLRSKGQIISKYFQSYMEYIAGTKNLEDFTSRTNIAHLTREKFIDLPISLPSLSEQTKIAKILSTWDKAITTTEQLLGNSRQQKKALMQQLLTGKKRFPGFEGEWIDEHLTAVAQVLVSPVDKKTIEGENPVRLCNYTDVYYNSRITKKLNFMQATATEREILKFTLKKGDVVITKDSETPGDIAVPAYVSENLGGVVCGYHLAILRPLEGRVDGEYLSYLLSLPKTRYYFFTLATGATRFGLSVGGIGKAHFKLPAIDEQQKIASVLSAADREIEVLQQELDNLKQQKRALMQQLLTGKRRVTI